VRPCRGVVRYISLIRPKKTAEEPFERETTGHCEYPSIGRSILIYHNTLYEWDPQVFRFRLYVTMLCRLQKSAGTKSVHAVLVRFILIKPNTAKEPLERETFMSLETFCTLKQAV
jgi:hypothetical protein